MKTLNKYRIMSYLFILVLFFNFSGFAQRVSKSVPVGNTLLMGTQYYKNMDSSVAVKYTKISSNSENNPENYIVIYKIYEPIKLYHIYTISAILNKIDKIVTVAVVKIVEGMDTEVYKQEIPYNETSKKPFGVSDGNEKFKSDNLYNRLNMRFTSPTLYGFNIISISAGIENNKEVYLQFDNK